MNLIIFTRNIKIKLKNQKEILLKGTRIKKLNKKAIGDKSKNKKLENNCKLKVECRKNKHDQQKLNEIEQLDRK